MPQIKIIHDQEKCIGCGACAGLCPQVFEMEVGKSKLIGGEKVGEEGEVYEREVEVEGMVEMLPSICPAGAIQTR